MAHQASARVVICGAGVIGAAVAYYLSLRGVAATVIERCGVACAASGKAGGFLALDWCDSSPLAALARKSFQLHAELSQTLGADYGYRRLTTLAVAAGAHATSRAPHKVPEELAWLDNQGIPYAGPGDTGYHRPGASGQVYTDLLDAALGRGAQLRIGCVDGLEVS
jgi:glycine/D-amino acid oxidase-like deaminating enzyme